ncbi:hypothetical protein QWA68_006474 [Fusarium oxysporum]|nr:hypothetical protein QWA68_006474 [Fusarium oxysporum]
MSSSVPQRTRLRQPETFTGFAKLPPELRLMIWELALDRSRHTVNVYPLKDNTSSNRPDPKPSSRTTLNFILEREYDMCMAHIGKTRCEVRHETTSECDDKGKDRGMWRACTESREIIMTKTTKGIFKSYFNNRFTARLTSILDADIIHLVRVPPHLDEVTTKGIEPGPNLIKSVNEAIKSENVFLTDYKRPSTHMNARRAVRSFVWWLAPLGQVFLIDYGLKRTQPIEPGRVYQMSYSRETAGGLLRLVRLVSRGRMAFWDREIAIGRLLGVCAVSFRTDITVDAALLLASMYRSMTNGVKLENSEGVGCVGGRILSQKQ